MQTHWCRTYWEAVVPWFRFNIATWHITDLSYYKFSLRGKDAIRYALWILRFHFPTLSTRLDCIRNTEYFKRRNANASYQWQQAWKASLMFAGKESKLNDLIAIDPEDISYSRCKFAVNETYNGVLLHAEVHGLIICSAEWLVWTSCKILNNGF